MRKNINKVLLEYLMIKILLFDEVESCEDTLNVHIISSIELSNYTVPCFILLLGVEEWVVVMYCLSLFRVLTNFTAVLHVNNSLVRRIQPASSWPRDSHTVSLDVNAKYKSCTRRWLTIFNHCTYSLYYVLNYSTSKNGVVFLKIETHNWLS